MPITAVIITYNEAHNISACVQSLMGVADEILVIDSFSTDDTPKIAEKAGAKVIQMEWNGYAQTKNAANAIASTPYILSIDADERLSEEMRNAILFLKNDLTGAYSFRRKNFFCGKWIRFCGWYPDIKVRLFPKNTSTWQGDFVHETLSIQVPITLLEGDLQHFTYTKKEQLPQKLQKYTDLAAQEMLKNSKKATIIKLYFSPILTFFKTYFLQFGIFDGYYGLFISYHLAKGVYMKYRKLAVISRRFTQI